MFAHDRHSNQDVRWLPTPIETRIEVWSVLKRHYPNLNNEVHVIHQTGSGSGGRNYRVTCKTPGGEDKNFFVQQKLVHTPDEMVIPALVMSHLQSRDVRVPLLIPASHDDTFIWRNGCAWWVFEFMSGDHFFGTDDELTEAAQAITRMHVALRTFPLKDNVRHIDDVIGPLDASYWDDISLLSRENEFEMMLHLRKSMIQEYVMRNTDALAGIPQAEEIIHGDLHPHNFLFPPESSPAIIDFGVVCRADQRYDIAMACHRLCRQCVVRDGRPWQETLEIYVRLFLEAYASITPLCDYCIRTLPAFAAAFLCRKMAYNFELYMEGKKTPVACHAQFQRFFGFLDEMEALEKLL